MGFGLRCPLLDHACFHVALNGTLGEMERSSVAVSRVQLHGSAAECGMRMCDERVRLHAGCPTQEAAQEALEAAERSYAPYSGCPAGLALLAGPGGGRAYTGGVLESCAYNPTINPLQAACIVFVAQGQGEFSEVGHPCSLTRRACTLHLCVWPAQDSGTPIAHWLPVGPHLVVTHAYGFACGFQHRGHEEA